MIHIDPRSGSGELLPLFLSHRTRPEARLSHLPAADFCFTISGPSGPTLLGIERKTISDLIQSVRTHRLSGADGQIPKLLDHYSPHVYLLVEGFYRVNKDTGYLQWPRNVGGQRTWVDIQWGKKPFYASEVDNALSSIVEHYPVKLWKTRDEQETVEWVLNKYHWGQKEWENHRGHTGIYAPAPHVTVDKVSDVRRFAFSLKGSVGDPGIGWEKSWAVEQKFKTIEEAVNAPVEEWMKVDGIGKVLATKIWKRLRGLRND